MILAVGFGLFGFTFVLASGVALAYVTDCYQEVRRQCRNSPKQGFR
jgi:hypothetical protein